jgi:hypothetical protein
MFSSTRSLRRSVIAASLLVVAAMASPPVSTVATAPQPTAAESGCDISSMLMKSVYRPRSRAHYVFKPQIQCSRTKTWSVTLAIRHRRLGPDATRSFRGVGGTRRFRLATGCKNENRFNGDIWLKQGGRTVHAVRKNVEC